MLTIFSSIKSSPVSGNQGVVHLGMARKYGPEVSKERTLSYQVRLGETLPDDVSCMFVVIATYCSMIHDSKSTRESLKVIIY